MKAFDVPLLVKQGKGRAYCFLFSRQGRAEERFSRKRVTVMVERRFVVLRFVEPLPYSNPRLVAQGKYAEAGPLYDRSQAMREKVFGPKHPQVAASLNIRALLMNNQVTIQETFVVS